MRRLLVLAFTICLAGCVTEGQLSGFQVDHRGDQQHAERTKSAECPDQTILSYDVSRLDGDLSIFVIDGAGKVVFVREFNDPEYAKDGGAELGANEHSLFGSPGTWRVGAEWTASDVAFSVELRCSLA